MAPEKNFVTEGIGHLKVNMNFNVTLSIVKNKYKI